VKGLQTNPYQLIQPYAILPQPGYSLAILSVRVPRIVSRSSKSKPITATGIRRSAVKPTRRPLEATSSSGPNSSLPRWRRYLWIAAEAGLLLWVALVVTLTVMGRAGSWFGGTSLTESLLPFAGTVLILAIAGSVLFWLWRRVRRVLVRLGPRRPALAALVLALGALVFATRPAFRVDLASLRSLVGGAEQAGKDSIAHQVFAAYRRTDLEQMRILLERSRPYLPAIRSAALACGVDEEVMVGIGAAESSFLPRDSKDGGRGLFQITAAPPRAAATVARLLRVGKPDVRNPRHNAYLAAATLRHYLDEMNGDLFLGLLAYNMGPRNGGLRSVMKQYGARDFLTIQPYLQHLPRDYPIRVLNAALAFRLWREEGALPRYEDGENARVIQSIGIPGFDW